VAPVNAVPNPTSKAASIFLAPFVVCPNFAISNLVIPNCSSNILNTGTPLSAIWFNSSNPSPP